VYDAIIVGARCSGAPVAMLLARRGWRVALVDRASFPSDTMSTHFLWPKGAARLASWGLRSRLEDLGCEPITQVVFDPGVARIVGSPPAVEGVADSYCPRRTILDALLVDAAVEAGAELIERFVVSDLCFSEGRVVGIRGHQRGSPSATSKLDAHVVVGADGLHSTVGELVGAPRYREWPPMTCVYYSYWSGIPERRASFHARAKQLVLVWPTNCELTCVYVAWPVGEYPRVKADVEARFRAALGAVPGLADRLAAGQREQRFTGTRDLPNMYRVSAGPGWALVGDAGHHKDPSTGMGISDAFAAADLLAMAIDDGLTGSQHMDEALADYQVQRDAYTENGLHLTLRTSGLTPPSVRLEEIYRRAAEQPERAESVLGVLAGSIPFTELQSRAS
jgi:flavin-dependent dehydrogenase